MSYDNLSCVSYNLLKFYQLFTGEERRIPIIFSDFHFCRSRVIGLDMTENRIFTLCRMITWVVFLRMFWNFISNLPVKIGGSLSFLTVFTFAIPELLHLMESRVFYPICHTTTWINVSQNLLKFYSWFNCEKRGIPSETAGMPTTTILAEFLRFSDP